MCKRELGDGEPSPPQDWTKICKCGHTLYLHTTLSMPGRCVSAGCECVDFVGAAQEVSLKKILEQSKREVDSWQDTMKNQEPGAQEVSHKLLSAEQIAQKLANVGGIERWRVILQEWLDSYIAIWKQEEILWRTQEISPRQKAMQAAKEIESDCIEQSDDGYAFEVSRAAAIIEKLLGEEVSPPGTDLSRQNCRK